MAFVANVQPYRLSLSFALWIVCFTTAVNSRAATFGYMFGVSLENTVVPGSIVSIGAALKNTGSQPITFPNLFIGGLPSVQGGSVPFGSANSAGDWSILANSFTFGPTFGIEDFYPQFQGVVVNPGEVFDFTLGTFRAPTDQPLGSSARPGLNFGINFTDTVFGNLLSIGIFPFDNRPPITFTLGTANSASELSFFEGLVVDISSMRQISGPPVIPTSPPASVPEVLTFWPLAGFLVCFLWVRRYRPEILGRSRSPERARAEA